jgi:hypothetical protein
VLPSCRACPVKNDEACNSHHALAHVETLSTTSFFHTGPFHSPIGIAAQSQSTPATLQLFTRSYFSPHQSSATFVRQLVQPRPKQHHLTHGIVPSVTRVLGYQS